MDEDVSLYIFRLKLKYASNLSSTLFSRPKQDNNLSEKAESHFWVLKTLDPVAVVSYSNNTDVLASIASWL